MQSKNLTLSFSSESSIEEELKRESTTDAITILVGFLLFLFLFPLLFLSLAVFFQVSDHSVITVQLSNLVDFLVV